MQDPSTGKLYPIPDDDPKNAPLSERPPCRKGPDCVDCLHPTCTAITPIATDEECATLAREVLRLGRESLRLVAAVECCKQERDAAEVRAAQAEAQRDCYRKQRDALRAEKDVREGNPQDGCITEGPY